MGEEAIGTGIEEIERFQDSAGWGRCWSFDAGIKLPLGDEVQVMCVFDAKQRSQTRLVLNLIAPERIQRVVSRRRESWRVLAGHR